MIRGRGVVLVEGRGELGFALFPIDLSRSERWLTTHGMPIDADNPAASGMTYNLLLAYNALRREGQLDNGVGFEPWADTVVDIVDLELDVVPPTPRDHSDG